LFKGVIDGVTFRDRSRVCKGECTLLKEFAGKVENPKKAAIVVIISIL